MGKRSSSTRRRTGIQLAKPAEASISVTKGSGTARSQKEWFPTTFRFDGAPEGPRHGCAKMGRCAQEYMKFALTPDRKGFFLIWAWPQAATVSVLYIRRDEPHVCVISDDELDNELKDAWTDVGTEKSLAAPKEW